MKKIAILGPESTGKSELAEKLAKFYDVPWVPEYARRYVEKLKREYTFEDVCEIARVQIMEEDRFAGHLGPEFVFFDTDLIITKVWFEYCYHKIPDFVQQRLDESYFDAYLLCYPDLPWMPDPVRENGDKRMFFFDWYKKEIENTRKPYFVISGINEQRLNNAISALHTLQKK
ncbi:MAG: ATP-binding protein [Paludibacter sp.]|nr:ATP-binding protein [Paludibacter sp.]